MSRRVIVVAAVVCLVGLAGCMGSTSPNETESPTSVQPTETPTATPTATATSTPTATATPTAIPATTVGRTATEGQSGAAFAKQLLSRHESAIADRDYELNRYQYRKRTVGNTTFVSNRSVTIRSSIAAKRIVGGLTVTRARNGTQNVSETVIYATADLVFTKRVSPTDEVQYGSRETENFTNSHIVSSTTVLEGIVQSANFGRAGTIERDGVTLVRYEVTSLAEGSVSADASVSELTGHLLVGEDGIVREAALGYTVRTDGDDRNEVIEKHYELTPFDRITVEKPDWVSEAKKASD